MVEHAVSTERPSLSLAEHFTSRLLPQAIRRLAARRGLSRTQQRDLLEDAAQEIRLDALEHAQEICALPPTERHQRWFRATERFVYRQRLCAPRLTEAEGTEPPLSAEGSAALDLAQEPWRSLREHTQRHGNGRPNLKATAGRMRLPERQVRQLWERYTSQLGYDDQFLAFWARRLAEALTGLAADLLRDSGVCHLLPQRREPPDPQGRRRRIRRIRRMLQLRPLPHHVRRALSLDMHDRAHAATRPLQILVQATTLAPDFGAAWLWRFEAALACDQLADATTSLAHARRLRCELPALALARARLLEAQDLLPRACRLLHKAARRWPDARLRAAVDSLLREHRSSPLANNSVAEHLEDGAHSQRASGGEAAEAP